MKISNFNGVNNATDDTVLAISYTTDGGTTYQTKKIRMADMIDDFSVSDLSDVNITTPATGDVLSWNGTEWVDGGNISLTGNLTVSGTLTLPDADITFEDNNGTYPTSGKGFYWDLNTDEARIYAIQSANDYIDLVFKVSDNTNNQNDRWVFWLDSYEGQSADSYPLTMSADNAWFFCDPSATDGKPDTTDWKVIIDSNGAIRQKAPSSVTPSENGELVIEATNNTTLTFKLKGSDGVVRTGTLTLS